MWVSGMETPRSLSSRRQRRTQSNCEYFAMKKGRQQFGTKHEKGNGCAIYSTCTFFFFFSSRGRGGRVGVKSYLHIDSAGSQDNGAAVLKCIFRPTSFGKEARKTHAQKTKARREANKKKIQRRKQVYFCSPFGFPQDASLGNGLFMQNSRALRSQASLLSPFQPSFETRAVPRG